MDVRKIEFTLRCIFGGLVVFGMVMTIIMPNLIFVNKGFSIYSDIVIISYCIFSIWSKKAVPDRKIPIAFKVATVALTVVYALRILFH